MSHKFLKSLFVAATGVVIMVAASRIVTAQTAQAFNFNDVDVGTVPAGWKVEGTRQQGPLATWEVTSDESERVLTLTRPNHDSNGTFNLCWTDTVPFKDGEISLRLRANSGEVDQGGGPIWRARDKDNYYICRANPLENNFRLYHVKDGTRKQLASATVTIPAGEWHTISVRHDGSHIVCALNGAKLLDVTDNTLPEAGGVGFWTKADAAASFDDLKIVAK